MGQLREVVERYYSAVNDADLRSLESLLLPDEDFMAPGPVRGNAQVELGWIRPFLAAFPGIDHRVVAAVEGDGVVAVEITITGTFTQPLVTPQAEMAPTGAGLDLTAANFFGIRDGHVGLHHIYFDQMSMLGQLGLLPPR
jgi:hypothetical protein